MTLNRRKLLFLLGATGGAVALSSWRSSGLMDTAIAQPTPASNTISLPPLPYDYNALEPHIDAQTMRFHHDNHHATYVKNLNAALEKYPNLKSQSVEQLLTNLESVPEAIRTTVRNNGGGHVNHSMFWQIMKPNGGGEPTGAISKAIAADFGDFATFKKQFNEAGTKRFGSGWVWLVRDDGKLKITTTPNQDSPLIDGNYPIMGNDVWEHAYYLKYQYRRADYLTAWWNVINWDEVNNRLAQASKA
ncbi:Fe-Mn family superoxide dismutase [Synechocystis sp. PCC 7509]|uniref:superoxide dismutase n=1 Tax=Synechocystis sp. PCC 7509 TaxID=927677 RepID=UPI0002ACE367